MCLCPWFSSFYPHGCSIPHSLAAIMTRFKSLHQVSKVKIPFAARKDRAHFRVSCQQSTASTLLRAFFSQLSNKTIFLLKFITTPPYGHLSRLSLLKVQVDGTI